jgi:hypothetical protein
MGLREDILTNPACAAAVAEKDCEAIAAVMSAGRKRGNAREIGNGTILEVLGLATGNALLDAINATPDFRYVKMLLDQGRLKIGSQLVQDALDGFVNAELLTVAQGAALQALGLEDYPYTPQEVAEALFNPDGSLK